MGDGVVVDRVVVAFKVGERVDGETVGGEVKLEAVGGVEEMRRVCDSIVGRWICSIVCWWISLD